MPFWHLFIDLLFASVKNTLVVQRGIDSGLFIKEKKKEVYETDTWFCPQLEDINASLYLVKCDAVLNRAKHKQGEKQTKMTKCCNGICLFFFLICVIWAPMLVRHKIDFAQGNLCCWTLL